MCHYILPNLILKISPQFAKKSCKILFVLTCYKKFHKILQDSHWQRWIPRRFLKRFLVFFSIQVDRMEAPKWHVKIQWTVSLYLNLFKNNLAFCKLNSESFQQYFIRNRFVNFFWTLDFQKINSTNLFLMPVILQKIKFPKINSVKY